MTDVVLEQWQAFCTQGLDKTDGFMAGGSYFTCCFHCPVCGGAVPTYHLDKLQVAVFNSLTTNSQQEYPFSVALHH